MIIFQFYTLNDALVERYDVYQQEVAKLTQELDKRNFLKGIATSMAVSVVPNNPNFIILFAGIIANQSDAKTILHLAREIQTVLTEINLYPSMFVLTNVQGESERGDLIIDTGHPAFKPNLANAAFVNKLCINVPEELLCAITCEIMDDPVYVKCNPEIIYDKENLKYSVFRQDLSDDPDQRFLLRDLYKRVVFDTTDIIPKSEIKDKLAEFMKSIQTEENFALIAMLGKYNLENASEPHLQKGLRNAANNNKIEDLKYFINKVKNISAKDNTRGSQKTALHWAVIKGHMECIKLLIEADAKTDIQDANGKTPTDYAIGKDSILQLLKASIEAADSSLSTGVQRVQL